MTSSITKVTMMERHFIADHYAVILPECTSYLKAECEPMLYLPSGENGFYFYLPKALVLSVATTVRSTIKHNAIKTLVCSEYSALFCRNALLERLGVRVLDHEHLSQSLFPPTCIQLVQTSSEKCI